MQTDNVFADIIYNLGFGCKKAFCAVGRFFAKTAVFIAKAIAKLFVAVFVFFRDVFVKYSVAAAREGKQFFSEVRRAIPVLKADFKEKPMKAFGRFVKYFFHAFAVHKRFNRAVLSTIIPFVSIAVLIVFYSAYGSLTFALEVFVEGESVGVVTDEDAYKDAEQLAKKRFASVGSEMAEIVPEYSVTLTTLNRLDDRATVCNNIIATVSDKTVEACGVYVDGEFLFTVGSEDTFLRVREMVFSEYINENPFVTADCKVDFAAQYTTETGVYPDNDNLISADALYDYFTAEKTPQIEHTVSADETAEDILEKYSLTMDELLANNENLQEDNIPEGSVLLIQRGEREVSIKVTKTYIKTESIPFDTVTQYDNNIFVGSTMTVVSGSNGQDIVSYTDTYIDGVKTETAKEILRYNASSPVNQLIKVGTMGIPVDGNGVAVSPRLTRDQGGSFVWPAPDNCFWLSQGYNPYNSHYGIDIVSSDDGSCRGRKIVAVADGIVTMATYHWSWGYYIRVDHGNGVVTGYAHALKDSFRVNVGDFVRAGQHLSSIGTSGKSTGYHLHFEVWIDGVRVNPLPYVYSEYTGVAIKYY